jgi:hypothetical protein
MEWIPAFAGMTRMFNRLGDTLASLEYLALCLRTQGVQSFGIWISDLFRI